VDPKAGGVIFGPIAEAWHRGRVGLADTTTARNRSYLGQYLQPTFDRTPVNRITTADIQLWIASLDDRGLAPATIRLAVAMLRAILKTAVRDKLIIINPADADLELPKRDPGVDNPMIVLTSEQVTELVDAAGIFYRVHLLTAAQTGLRFGELAGLPVENVDTLRGEIHVRQQLTEIAGRLTITNRLKTRSSRRTVTIGRHLSELLGEHIGRFPNEHGLVFTGTEGGRLRRSNFARGVLKPAARAIGIPNLRMHDLRHTHASLLLAAGEPIPVVSQRLGHKDLATTLRIYAHVIPGTERGPADAMDEMFGTIPTTVTNWRGMSGGYGTEAEVVPLSETQ
jgi:integrase